MFWPCVLLTELPDADGQVCLGNGLYGWLYKAESVTLTFPEVEIRIATTIDDRLACDAIRGSRFLIEDSYQVEFDLRDMCACTHLLGTDPRYQEPVATMRLRFLHSTYIAWERLTVASNANPRVLFRMVAAARGYSEAKGMALVLGCVSDRRLQRFWERQGASLKPYPSKKIGVSGDYHAMELPLDPLPPPSIEHLDALTEDDFLTGTIERTETGDGQVFKAQPFDDKPFETAPRLVTGGSRSTGS